MRLVSFLLCLMVLGAVPNYAQAQGIREDFDSMNEEERDASSVRYRFRGEQQERFLAQLFMVPVYYLGYTAVHEGGHALAALSYGLEVDRFEPYPHRVALADDEDDYGCRSSVNSRYEFTWGYTGIRFGDEQPSQGQLAMVSITPYLTDIVLFTTSDLLLQYVVDPTSIGAPFLLVGGMITPLVDFTVGMSCFHEGCDMHNFSEQAGISQAVVGVVGFMMVSIAIWRVIHQFRRVFMERRPNESQRVVSVMPIADRERLGLSLSAIF